MQTNSQDEVTGAWSVPSKELLDDVIQRIGNPQHRRVFFDGLRNPAWAERLLDSNVLAPPLEREATSEDPSSYESWAAGPYLALVAADAPKAVAAALLRAVRESNSYEVHRFLVKAAKSLPAERIAGLIPFVVKLPADAFDPVLGLGFAELIPILADGDRKGAAFRLAGALLRPRRSEDSSTLRRAKAAIESYWYGKALGHFTTGLRGDPRLLTELVAWLECALRDEGVDPDAEIDYGYLTRPSIAEHPDGVRRGEVTQHLVDAVRDTAIDDLRAGADPAAIAALLERKGFHLPRRIERHILAVALAEGIDVLPAARTCLLDRGPLDGTTTPREYFELAAATLPQFTETDYAEWEEIILSGPVDTPKRRQDIRTYLRPDQTEEQVWAEYVDRWRHDRLGTIGAAALRGRTADLLTELTDRLGESTDPSPDAVRVTRHDQDGEKYLPELRELDTAAAVLEFASIWTPPEGTSLHSEDYDMGRAFATVVAERALEFSALADEALRLPEPFATRFLDGIRNALEQDVAVDWEPLLEAAMRLPSPETEPQPEAEEPRWYYQVVTALNIIEKGLGKPALGFTTEHIDLAIAFATRYILHSDPAPDNPSAIDDIQNDPLIRALNSAQPLAILTTVHIATYAKSIAAEQAESYADQVTEALDALLIPARVPSSPIAAAFGASLGRLQWNAPEWLAACAPLLLAEDWYGDVVASVTLLYHSRISAFLEVLAPKLGKLISRAAAGEEFDWAWTQHESVAERIGLSLLFLLFNGDQNASQQLADRFFAEAPVAVRASVLSSAGYALGHSGEVPAEVVARAQDFWDGRRTSLSDDASAIAELAGFHTWVHSDVFPVEWWLPRLVDVADAIDLEGITYLGEHLAEASHRDPGLALDVLSRLLRRESPAWVRHDLLEHADVVLARAMLSTDETAESAQDLMSYLGHQGHVDIAERVERYRTNLS